MNKKFIIMCIANIAIIISLVSISISKQSELTSTLTNLQEITQELNNENIILRSEINKTNTDIEYKKHAIDSAISELQTRRSGKRYEPHDITYAESRVFIRYQDQTEQTQYDDETFSCINYALTVNNNAEEKGMRCGVVIIYFLYSGPHAIVAFDTTDEGIVFFEPQTDEKVNLQEYKDYWSECVEPRWSYYYYAYSDMIVDYYEIFW